MTASAILGISPGTRVLGYAVAEHEEIIACGVKPFKTKWSKDKLQYIVRTIEGLCIYHSVRTITIKRADPLRCSRELGVLIRSLLRLAQRHKLRVVWYSLHELERYAKTSEKNGRTRIAEAVLTIRPDLRKEYLKELNRGRKYYSKMFEAILAAHIVEEKQLRG